MEPAIVVNGSTSLEFSSLCVSSTIETDRASLRVSYTAPTAGVKRRKNVGTVGGIELWRVHT